MQLIHLKAFAYATLSKNKTDLEPQKSLVWDLRGLRWVVAVFRVYIYFFTKKNKCVLH